MFDRILYPVDLAHTDLASGFASDVERIAGAFDARLEVMTVLPGFGSSLVANYFPPDAEEKAGREAEQRLRAFTQQVFRREVDCTVTLGTPWKRIVEAARTGGADLIVMPHCDQGWPEAVLVGSCARAVSERAPCSVLILRPPDRDACPAP